MRLTFTLLLASVVSSILAAKDHLPLSDQIMTAKTVYIENSGGPAQLGDGAYEEITKWGHFQVVTDKTKADLILFVSIQASGRTILRGNRAVAVPASGLAVLDPANGDVLWSDSKVAGAFSKSAIKRAIDELRKRMEEQAETAGQHVQP